LQQTVQIPSLRQSQDDDNQRVSLEHRWLIVGTTGSGKTYATKAIIRHMLRYFPIPVYVLDTKAEDEFDGFAPAIKSILPPVRKGQFCIWQPLEDDLDLYDQWFANILNEENTPCFVVNDEIANVTDRDGRGTRNFQLIMKQGRKKMKSIINCTQELAYNPRQIVTQTTHILRFQLIGERDPRTGNSLVKREREAPEPKHDYGFFYYYTRGRALTPAREFESIQQFLGGE
jgi:hypothetical protein